MLNAVIRLDRLSVSAQLIIWETLTFLVDQNVLLARNVQAIVLASQIDVSIRARALVVPIRFVARPTTFLFVVVVKDTVVILTTYVALFQSPVRYLEIKKNENSISI